MALILLFPDADIQIAEGSPTIGWPYHVPRQRQRHKGNGTRSSWGCLADFKGSLGMAAVNCLGVMTHADEANGRRACILAGTATTCSAADTTAARQCCLHCTYRLVVTIGQLLANGVEYPHDLLIKSPFC